MNDSYKRCTNCGAHMEIEDKYCTKCGTLYGQGHYSPDRDINFACVYGPPPRKRVHKCKKCDHSWISFDMLDRERFCPECGGEAYTVSTEDY